MQLELFIATSGIVAVLFGIAKYTGFIRRGKKLEDVPSKMNDVCIKISKVRNSDLDATEKYEKLNALLDTNDELVAAFLSNQVLDKVNNNEVIDFSNYVENKKAKAN